MSNTVINRNPNILGGAPVFMGTRVPVRILMEYFETGEDLNEFLDQHPAVSREQAVQLIKLVTEALMSDKGHEITL